MSISAMDLLPSQRLLPAFSAAFHQPLSLALFTERRLHCTVLRLDKIDPLMGGNKLFKLLPFLDDGQRLKANGITSYGGPFSNHLVATARACQLLGWPSTAMVRGHANMKSAVVDLLRQMGAQIRFADRGLFAEAQQQCGLQLDGHYHIPMGGWHPLGIKGAGMMAAWLPDACTHVVLAAGTGTSVAGMASARPGLHYHAVVCAPDLPAVQAAVQQQIAAADIHFHYPPAPHRFGRSSSAIDQLMRTAAAEHQLPLDFVYTAPAFGWMLEAIGRGLFPAGSQLCFVHTGGLTGNLGLSSS